MLVNDSKFGNALLKPRQLLNSRPCSVLLQSQTSLPLCAFPASGIMKKQESVVSIIILVVLIMQGKRIYREQYKHKDRQLNHESKRRKDTDIQTDRQITQVTLPNIQFEIN